jgi:hypothetical protein
MVTEAVGSISLPVGGFVTGWGRSDAVKGFLDSESSPPSTDLSARDSSSSRSPRTCCLSVFISTGLNFSRMFRATDRSSALKQGRSIGFRAPVTDPKAAYSDVASALPLAPHYQGVLG